MIKASCLFFGLIFAINACAENKLIFAIDLIRHGDRTPIVDISTPPYKWQEGPGQLTSIGKKQEYQLGQEKRQLYINQYHWLPESDQNQKTQEMIYVRSSDFERTIVSAQYFLKGLYPQKVGSTQNIIIHTVPISKDNLFFGLPGDKKLILQKKYVLTNPVYEKENKALQPYYAFWSKNTGFEISTLVDTIGVGDTLYVRTLHHAPMPPNLSAQDIQTIIGAGNTAIALVYATPQISIPSALPLLNSINQYLEEASQAHTSLKYVLLSGHDIDILSLMSALGVPLATEPPYASDISILLFETEQHQYFVQIEFNDQILSLPACHAQRCPLDKFLNVYSQISSVE